MGTSIHKLQIDRQDTRGSLSPAGGTIPLPVLGSDDPAYDIGDKYRIDSTGVIGGITVQSAPAYLTWNGTGDGTADGHWTVEHVGKERYPRLVETTDDLQGFINLTQSLGETTLELRDGVHTVSSDLVLDPDTTFNSGQRAAGYTLKGFGENVFRQVEGVAPYERTGTYIEMAAGFSVKTENGFGVKIKDMTIIGQVEDGPLMDMSMGLTIHGELSGVSIYNDIKTPVVGNPVCLRVDALFLAKGTSVDLSGSTSYRSSSEDSAKPSNELFFGTGLEITREGLGAGGGFTNCNIRGFNVGIDCGTTQADWDATPTTDTKEIHSITYKDELQISWSNTGILMRRGLQQLNLIDSFFEFISERGICVQSGGGNLNMERGNISGLDRPFGGSIDEIKDAYIVLGHETIDSEGGFGQIRLNQVNFNFIRQCAVMILGSDTAEQGDVILDGCTGKYNSGAMMLIKPSPLGRVPNILIKDWSTYPDGIPYVTARFVQTFTRSSDYARHNYSGDYRHYCRIENCGELGENIIIPADVNKIDLSVRKFPPVAARLSTTSADFELALGSAVPIGMETTLRKQQIANKFVLNIPAGYVATDSTGTDHGAAVQVNNNVANHTIFRANEYPNNAVVGPVTGTNGDWTVLTVPTGEKITFEGVLLDNSLGHETQRYVFTHDGTSWSQTTADVDVVQYSIGGALDGSGRSPTGNYTFERIYNTYFSVSAPLVAI